MFIAALFTVAKVWKQPKYPLTDVWINKIWSIYTMEHYSPLKKEILPFVTAWMNLEGIMLSEMSQKEKGKYYVVSLICETLKKSHTQRIE